MGARLERVLGCVMWCDGTQAIRCSASLEAQMNRLLHDAVDPASCASYRVQNPATSARALCLTRAIS